MKNIDVTIQTGIDSNKKQSFEGVGKIIFDCMSIDITYNLGGGGYFTSFPISPKKYRDENPDCFSVKNVRGEVSQLSGVTIFTIYDDWNEKRVVTISNRFKKTIKDAILLGKKEGILTSLTPPFWG